MPHFTRLPLPRCSFTFVPNSVSYRSHLFTFNYHLPLIYNTVDLRIVGPRNNVIQRVIQKGSELLNRLNNFISSTFNSFSIMNLLPLNIRNLVPSLLFWFNSSFIIKLTLITFVLSSFTLLKSSSFNPLNAGDGSNMSHPSENTTDVTHMCDTSACFCHMYVITRC